MKNRVKRVLIVFYLLGLVSLFADMVYEGGRSISGAYLENLAAPPIGPALIGLGDFAGYVLRFIAGYLATLYQSSRLLWGFVIVGYTVTAISIPLLAFASAWNMAVVLYVIDRLGKGLRAPSRDVIVAEVSESFGLGKGFGIHELLDQLGAFIGPLIVSISLIYWGYRTAFLLLLIPGTISIALVISAFTLYPSLKSVDKVKKPVLGFKGLGEVFWLYVLASSALALGFMHWAISSYYLTSRGVLSDYEIGLAYTIAMLADALVAIPLGHVFDKIKLNILLIQPPLALLYIVILLYAPRELIPLAAVCWGVIMCSEESIMRASIALIVEPSKRPFAYGAFGLLYGLTWAIGGFIYGFLLGNKLYVLTYAVITNTASLLLYIKLSSKYEANKSSLKITD
ncbi:MAG: MFS transporter [Desulfurococcaceae archaeon]